MFSLNMRLYGDLVPADLRCKMCVDVIHEATMCIDVFFVSLLTSVAADLLVFSRLYYCSFGWMQLWRHFNNSNQLIGVRGITCFDQLPVQSSI